MELTNAYNLVIDKLEKWIDTAIAMLPNLVAATLVLVIFYVMGKLVRKAISKLLHKVTENKTIISLLETIVGLMIVGVGVFIALGILQLSGTVKSLLAGAGIIGLALGFAFQDIASNFMAGIFLSIRRLFRVGDVVETNGFYGIVQKLNLRSTIIRTPQGQIVYIPNKEIFDEPLTNFSQSGERRIDLECGVSYGDDLAKAKKISIEAVKSLDNYNDRKDVEFYYNEFGGSSINFVIRFWVRFNSNKDFWSARSGAIMAITRYFDENDIMIPFPIRTLDFGIRGGEKLDTVLGQRNKTENSE